MPVCEWSEVLGYNCVKCGNLASHWIGDQPYCCQCHGGELFSRKETFVSHVRAALVVLEKEKEEEAKRAKRVEARLAERR